MAIRQRLDDQSAGLDLAAERTGQLIDLKTRILANPDLADAAVNLELMGDVQDQMANIADSFGKMRHWIVEILAFEPMFNRAMRKPATAYGAGQRATHLAPANCGK